MKSDLNRLVALGAVFFLSWTFAGCGSSTPPVADLDDELAAQKARVAALEKEVEQAETARRAAERETELARKDAEQARRDAERALTSAKAEAASEAAAWSVPRTPKASRSKSGPSIPVI